MIPEAVQLSKFPANRRDLALIVDESVQSDVIVRACCDAGGELVTAAKLFDVYQGQGVEEGKKSLAIALTLQAADRTLEDADMTAVMDKVVSTLANEHNAHLRD